MTLKIVSTIPEQLFFGNGEPSEDKFIAPENNWLKPKGGLWTSTYRNDSSDWAEWCISEHFDDPYAHDWWILQPADNLRVIEIDNANDCNAMFEQYRDCKNSLSLITGFSSASGLGNALDAEKMARDGIDGIHLTVDGQIATRFNTPYSLYGWDCESTCWLRWKFASKRLISQCDLRRKVWNQHGEYVYADSVDARPTRIIELEG